MRSSLPTSWPASHLTLALCALLVGWTAPAASQSATMPLLLIEGNQYSRESFDENGRLDESQRMEIGRVVQSADEIELAVKVYPTNGTGLPADTIRTTIRCQVLEANMVMSVLALIGADGRSVRIGVSGGEILYPASPAVGSLPSVELRATVEQGVVGFFGGQSRISLSNRTVQRPDGQAGGYSLTTRIDLAFYVFRVRVRSRSYQMEETVEPDRGLVRQVLTASDGGSIVLTLADSSRRPIDY